MVNTAEEEFLALSQLFDSIGVVEKGIEKIYHYLLVNKRIDNLEKVSQLYNLSLKRGYKICAVLSDKELIKIYDRPMKIQLATPIIPIWQRIINSRIEALQNEFQEKKKNCEDTFDALIKNYNITEEITQEPVEFLHFTANNFDDLYYPFLAKECKIAIGIRYENPLVNSLREKRSIEELDESVAKSIVSGVNKIKENLPNLNIQVVFNSEILETLLNSKEFELFSTLLKSLKIAVKTINIRVTTEAFSNFSLTDTELIQPSFDPANILMGAYVSRNKNIFSIFDQKFKELFEKGVPINDFLKQNKAAMKTSLVDFESLALCII